MTHDSEPYRRVVSTTALYTLILVFFFRCLLFQTLLYSLPKAQLAFASLLSTSLSILASDVMVHPRYVNWWTALSSVSPIVMWGVQYSSRGAGWWSTSVFFRLTSSPKSWAASAKLDVRHCRALSEWATRAASSAKRRSRISCSKVFVCACSLLRLNRLPSRRHPVYLASELSNENSSFTPAMSNQNGLLGQKVCHYLNHGRTLNDILRRAGLNGQLWS